MKKQVVTYSFAYVPGQINLCRNCEDRVNAAVPLGPVLYGLHKDYCAGCEDDNEEQTNEDI